MEDIDTLARSLNLVVPITAILVVRRSLWHSCNCLVLPLGVASLLASIGNAFSFNGPQIAPTAYRQINTQPESDTVQINVGNVSSPAYAPSETLATVLGKHLSASRFHATWSSSGGRHLSRSSVLYDRKHRLLFFRCDVHSVPLGEFPQGSIFSGVTDAILRQDANDHKTSKREMPYDDQVDVIFNDLTIYGCQRRNVQESTSGHNKSLRLKSMNVISVNKRLK